MRRPLTLIALAVLGSVLFAAAAPRPSTTAASTSTGPAPAPAGPPADGAPAIAVAADRLPPLIFRRDAAPGGPVLTALGRTARIDFHAGGATVLQPEPHAPSAAYGGPRLPGMPVRFDAAGNLGAAPWPADRQPEWRRVEITFVGAAADAVPVGEGRRPTIVSILKGPETAWQRARPTFGAVRYPSAWPGIDVVFDVAGDGLAMRVEAAPGADTSAVALAVGCAGPCPTRARGLAATAADAAGDRPAVLRWAGDGVGFAVDDDPADAADGADAPRDRDRTTLAASSAAAILYAGFWGFPGDDRGLGIAVGRDGAAYFTGHTFAESETDIDAYLIKVRPDGTALDYVTILGGDGADLSFDVAVDGAGNAYFGGATDSKDDTRPTKGGPDITANGGTDALVGKLDPTGDIVFCGSFGGSLYDLAEGVAVDGEGHMYVTGMTLSTAFSFPLKVGPDLTYNGAVDSFITKLVVDPTGAKVSDNIVYSGYIGGARHDAYVYTRPEGQFVSSGQMALDAAGAAYISGQTQSDERSFPDGDGFGDVPGADRTFAGMWDAWIAKVRPDGAALAYATFFGGANEDLAFGMDVDPSGAAYFAAWTDSAEDTLHPVVGPDLTYNGVSDAMAGKLTPDGHAFAYLGYVGGAEMDAGIGAKVDAYGRLAVIGYAGSDQTTFPVVGGPDLTFNGTNPEVGDAFVTLVAADPSSADVRENLVLSGYVGGALWDEAFWLAFGPDGSLYVVGDTHSGPDTFPDGVGMAGRTSPHGDAAGKSDAFVVKIAVPPAGAEGGTPGPAASATSAATGAPTWAATAEATSAPTAVATRRTAFLPWANRP